MNLNEQNFEQAVKNLSKKTIATQLLVYPKYLRDALRILGKIKQPVKRVAGLRKRKRALYWRDSV